MEEKIISEREYEIITKGIIEEIEIINIKKIKKIINGFKKDKIFWDRAEYDEEDLSLSLPDLSQEEIKELHKRIRSEKQRILEGGN